MGANRTLSGPEENDPRLLPPEENEAINHDLRKGIAILREHRQTHVEWRDWFRKHPDDPRQESLGDADFHNETIQTYNWILAVLETMLESPALEDRDLTPAEMEAQGVR